MLAVQPQPAGTSSRMSIWSVSPDSAPVTSTGPVTWSTWSKTRVSSEAVVESAVSWPFDASRQSNATTSPDPTVATGAMAGSQARWFCSRETWIVAVGITLVSRSRGGDRRFLGLAHRFADRTELLAFAGPEVQADHDPDQHPDPDERRDVGVGRHQGCELEADDRDRDAPDDTEEGRDHEDEPDDRHDEVLEPVELGPLLAPEVADRRQVDRHVHPGERQADRVPDREVR